jgi:peroxiredoxin Q/BCP
LGVDVLAISGDYVYSHHEWAKHHDLPFRLLSDHDHRVARAYDSYNDATGYNRRTVFAIDRSGRIAYLDLDYSVRDDSDYRLLVSALKIMRSQK